MKWLKNTYLIVQIRWILFLIRKARIKEEKLMSKYLKKINKK